MSTPAAIDSNTPEIRKHKKRFGSDVLCSSPWGVNLLTRTDGLMLLEQTDRERVSGAHGIVCAFWVWQMDRADFRILEVLDAQLMPRLNIYCFLSICYGKWKGTIFRVSFPCFRAEKCCILPLEMFAV